MLLELESSIALASTAVCSALVFYWRRDTPGKIRLPIEHEGISVHNPFDVTNPDDFIDGIPVAPETFWDQMRMKKLLMSLLLVVIVILEVICTGWAIATNEQATMVYAMDALYSVYTLFVAVRSISQSTTAFHSESVLHLCWLSLMPAIAFTATQIIPDTPLKSSESKVEADPTFAHLHYAITAIYWALGAIAMTTARGPPLHLDTAKLYSAKTLAATTNDSEENVCGSVGASLWDTLVFSYSTPIVYLGNRAASLEIGDLPVLPANMRATVIFAKMQATMRRVRLRFWTPEPGSGWQLCFQLYKENQVAFHVQMILAAISAVLFYAPAFFLQRIVKYLEVDPLRENRAWGLVFVFGLFFINVFTFLLQGQLWSISTTTLQVRFKVQLNTALFKKTLVRKDVASSAPPPSSSKGGDDKPPATKEGEEDDFSSKAQVMTLMTTDVDRVSEFAWHCFTLVDAPIEILVGSFFLYQLLGNSSLIGLLVTSLFLPMNHFAGKVVVNAQDSLMKARDERVALMNEILGGIRMLKFMAWERNFAARVLKIRAKELKFQKLNYLIETLWNAIWNASPMLVSFVAFWHFAVYRQQTLTPSIAFTSIIVFNELKFSLNAIPETILQLLQSMVSMRRIEKYLNAAEIKHVPDMALQSQTIACQSATITWPQDRSSSSAASSAASSTVSTPRHKFMLIDLSLQFPNGELSLICGKLGSGKTLLLLALLGEADILGGQMMCPRSPPDSLASFATSVPDEEWVVPGICAYVPQAAWLRNASIKENILFNLPFNKSRYNRVLEACALVSDLRILEDGDESEIGERGVSLSGGQKARVSLARAVYSRASILLLDDVLSAVDAHTAHHLYNECITGDLMKGRTVILVSHHIQLCAPGAGYVVALENGRVQFSGSSLDFRSSETMTGLVQSTTDDAEDDKEEAAIETLHPVDSSSDHSDISSAVTPTVVDDDQKERKAPRKLVEDEARATGHIHRDIWRMYFKACGGSWYWLIFITVLVASAAVPVAENTWLKIWSSSAQVKTSDKGAVYYITVYASINLIGLIITTLRWFSLYAGSIKASHVLHEQLLEGILFAKIRFHDTVSRGRVLNRFGKDLEGVDSNLSDNFGRSAMYGLSALTTFITLFVVGGLPFILAAAGLGAVYFQVGKVYSQTSKDMRRLDSVTRSPLYAIYGETISGVTVLRAFGASSKFLRDMIQCVDTNINPYYHMWGVNRWLSARFNLLSSAVVGVVALVAVLTPDINAALAGFALTFASTITNDLLFLTRRFVALEQSMVALERIKEYTILEREAPEFTEPRPPASWPSQGLIQCEDLVVRYAPDLPPVLHKLNFQINAGEKVGVLGRTGSGKSTLALSFFRFVEAAEGRISVDNVDISHVGLTDLRTKLTIIPQDPTILSGNLRSTVDVFGEYEDSEIFAALRRVHLIPSEDTPEEVIGTVNANVFRDLDSAVSEGGENFSTGEKQLLCMARAILKRARILIMDEATASVDYSTDELISKTIQQEFADSTVLTIAHRLRTVIQYDRVMLLEDGKIIEFDRPSVLLGDPNSKFSGLCRATGKEEFSMLKRMAKASDSE